MIVTVFVAGQNAMNISYSQEYSSESRYILKGLLANIVTDNTSDYPEWIIGDAFKQVNHTTNLERSDIKFYLIQIAQTPFGPHPMYDFKLLEKNLTTGSEYTTKLDGLSTVEMNNLQQVPIPKKIDPIDHDSSVKLIDPEPKNMKFKSVIYLENQNLICMEFSDHNYC